MLEGVYDDESVLHCFKGTPHIVRKIWCILKNMLRSHIKLPNDYFPGKEAEDRKEIIKPDCKFFVESGRCFPDAFPKPCGININMMPFVSGGHHFEEFKVPSILRPYINVFRTCNLEFLPRDEKVEMEANTLYWITNRTPQEWLPLKEKTYCQFFKVTSEMLRSSLLIIPHPIPLAFCRTRILLKLSKDVI